MKTLFHLFVGILIVSLPIMAWAGDNMPQSATHHSYIDVATGHKYVKNMDGSYTEFSRKGKVLRRDVPNDIPLLVSGKYIQKMPAGSFLLYEKTGPGQTEKQILSISQKHPQGWKCTDILMSFKNFVQYNQETGLGYSQDPSSIVFEGGLIIATGKAYYDVYTNHKYVKNPDNTYTEYSKRGKLLRRDVPNDLPLLTAGWNVLDLSPHDFVVYTKRQGSERQTVVLPAMDPHPVGWYAKDALAPTR